MPTPNSVSAKMIALPSLQKILLIAGRDKEGDHSLGEEAFYAASYWEKHHVPAEVYGNGRMSLIPEEIAAAVSRQPEHTLIVVDAHGDADDGHHRLRLGEGERFPTAALLRMISGKSDGRALDCIVMACSAGRVYDDLASQDFLAGGSHVATLASATESLYQETTQSFLDMLPYNFTTGQTSSQQILSRWVMRHNIAKLTPALGVCGERGITLETFPPRPVYRKILAQRYQ